MRATPERRPLGEPPALQWQQGGVGGDHADDRPAAGRQRPVGAGHDVEADLEPDGDAVDREPFAPAVVGLDEHADRHVVVTGRGATAVPMPPLKSWQIIPVPPPTAPSSTGPRDAAA